MCAPTATGAAVVGRDGAGYTCDRTVKWLVTDMKWLWLLLPLGFSLLLLADQRRLRGQVAVLVRRVARELGGANGAADTNSEVRSAENGRSGQE